MFAIAIAIPIHPIEKNRNRNHDCKCVINRRCEWTLFTHSDFLNQQHTRVVWISMEVFPQWNFDKTTKFQTDPTANEMQ